MESPEGYVLIGSDPPDKVGRAQAAAWYSTDLSTWSRKVTAGDPDGTSELTTMVQLSTRLVALGRSQPIACGSPMQARCDVPGIIAWTSVDGVTWEESTGSAALGAGTITGAAYGHDQAIAIGDHGWSTAAIWRSTDGLSWEAEDLPINTFADAHLFGVAAFAGGWVVTGMTGGHEFHCCADGWMIDETQPAAWWSSDGQVWQSATLGAGASEWGARMGDVFVGPDGLVAIDAGDPLDEQAWPQLWTSADGRTWSSVSADPDSAFRPIASDGTGILGRSTHSDLAISTDGITWRSIQAEGDAPGSGAPMEWAYVRPSWLVKDGLIAVGVGSGGASTRRLLLARTMVEAQQ